MADVKLTVPTKDATRFAKKVLKANDHFKSKTGADVPGVDVDHLRELAGAVLDKPKDEVPKPIRTPGEIEEARQDNVSKRAKRKVEELNAGKDHPYSGKVDENLPEHVKKDMRDQNEAGPEVLVNQYENDPLMRGAKAAARIASKIIHGKVVEEDKTKHSSTPSPTSDRIDQQRKLEQDGEIGRQ